MSAHASSTEGISHFPDVTGVAVTPMLPTPNRLRIKCVLHLPEPHVSGRYKTGLFIEGCNNAALWP